MEGGCFDRRILRMRPGDVVEERGGVGSGNGNAHCEFAGKNFDYLRNGRWQTATPDMKDPPACIEAKVEKAPVKPKGIPSVSEWGLIGLGGLLAGALVLMIRRRFRAQGARA